MQKTIMGVEVAANVLAVGTRKVKESYAVYFLLI